MERDGATSEMVLSQPEGLGAELPAREHGAVPQDATRWQHGAVTVHPAWEPVLQPETLSLPQLQLRGTPKT